MKALPLDSGRFELAMLRAVGICASAIICSGRLLTLERRTRGSVSCSSPNPVSLEYSLRPHSPTSTANRMELAFNKWSKKTEPVSYRVQPHVLLIMA